MGAIIIVSDSENEASLQRFVQFLELKKKLGLSCESVNESPCFAEVENVPCFG